MEKLTHPELKKHSVALLKSPPKTSSFDSCTQPDSIRKQEIEEKKEKTQEDQPYNVLSYSP